MMEEFFVVLTSPCVNVALIGAKTIVPFGYSFSLNDVNVVLNYYYVFAVFVNGDWLTFYC